MTIPNDLGGDRGFVLPPVDAFNAIDFSSDRGVFPARLRRVKRSILTVRGIHAAPL
ncbi:hypothetical protein [Novipirellula sp.]|uniref:hypothetical protein n=1 Tax=Novipirellula sp. TaxID=2795430 RepID=UPI003569FF72